jgi:hypothetical protein
MFWNQPCLESYKGYGFISFSRNIRIMERSCLSPSIRLNVETPSCLRSDTFQKARYWPQTTLSASCTFLQGGRWRDQQQCSDPLTERLENCASLSKITRRPSTDRLTDGASLFLRNTENVLENVLLTHYGNWVAFKCFKYRYTHFE